MLADLGYETGAIQATEEGAVAAAERHRPDLMIVDLKLAVGTGVAAVERITRAAPIPHVFMSGLGPLAARPGDVVLTKPFREADLFVGNREDMAETLAFAADGKVKADIELQPLSDINDIFQRLEQGKVAGRIVLDFVGAEPHLAITKPVSVAAPEPATAH
jgi:CheY-like chemotaxis protein